MGPKTSNDLIHQITELVANGDLKPGDSLPSVRSQAKTLGLAPNTVAAAYKRLRERGVVVGRGRQGTRVAPGSPQRAPVYPPPDKNLVDAMTGNPNPDFLPDLAAAAARLSSRPPVRYGDPMIDPELEHLAQGSFSSDGIDTTYIALASGAMDAVERTLAAQSLHAGDRIGVEDPGHAPVHTLARRMGLELVPLPLDQHGITPDGLGQALERGISALVVTPRAQNPTGAAFTRERADQLEQAMTGHERLVLISDDHAGAVAGIEYVGLRPPGNRWATIRSVAKSYGPDLRLAMICGDNQTIASLTSDIAEGPSWVSHLLQRIAIGLISDPSAQNLVTLACASYAHRRQLLISELGRHGIAATGASGLNVWIPVSNEQAAVEAARRAGFAIKSAGSYRLASGPAVRVTISGINDDEITKLATALALTHRSRSPIA